MKSGRIRDTVRAERRAQGITQSELARAVGCKQSAISMFEAGRSGALAQDVIAKIVSHLNIDVDSTLLESGENAIPEHVLKFCPIDECPSNVPYLVRGQLLLRPSMLRLPRQVRSLCPWCGELLQDQCPNAACGAAPGADSFCGECGQPYVTSCVELETSAEWVAGRQREIQLLRGLTESVPALPQKGGRR